MGDYEKWIRDGGMRPVPIPVNATDSKIDLLLSQVHGMLFTGGSNKLFKDEYDENG